MNNINESLKPVIPVKNKACAVYAATNGLHQFTLAIVTPSQILVGDIVFDRIRYELLKIEVIEGKTKNDRTGSALWVQMRRLKTSGNMSDLIRTDLEADEHIKYFVLRPVPKPNLEGKC